jgi:hypothetical protein
MIESTRGEEVEKAMEKLGSHMHKIKNASMDMSSICAQPTFMANGITPFYLNRRLVIS